MVRWSLAPLLYSTVVAAPASSCGGQPQQHSNTSARDGEPHPAACFPPTTSNSTTSTLPHQSTWHGVDVGLVERVTEHYCAASYGDVLFGSVLAMLLKPGVPGVLQVFVMVGGGCADVIITDVVASNTWVIMHRIR